MKEKDVLGKLLGFRRKAGEHRVKFGLRDAGKERRGGENGKKFFHEKSPFVENSTDLLPAFYYNTLENARRYCNETENH